MKSNLSTMKFFLICVLLVTVRDVTSKPEQLKEVTSKPEQLKEETSKPEQLKEVTSKPEELKEVPSKPEQLKEVTSNPEELMEVTLKPVELTERFLDLNYHPSNTHVISNINECQRYCNEINRKTDTPPQFQYYNDLKTKQRPSIISKMPFLRKIRFQNSSLKQSSESD